MTNRVDPDVLHDLIRRLEARTKNDNDTKLSAEIVCALFAPEGAYVDECVFQTHGWEIYYERTVGPCKLGLWFARPHWFRDLTTSLDACRDLMKAVLPPTARKNIAHAADGTYACNITLVKGLSLQEAGYGRHTIECRAWLIGILHAVKLLQKDSDDHTY